MVMFGSWWGLLLARLCGWIVLLVGFHAQVRLLMGSLIRWGCRLCSVVRWGYWLGSLVTSGQAGLQALFPGRVVPLVGFCNLAGMQAILCHCYWLSGASALSRWYWWLDSVFRQGHRLGFSVGQDLRLCIWSGRATGCALKLGGAIGWASWLSRLLTVLYFWARLLARFFSQNGPPTEPCSSRCWRLCSVVMLGQCLGSLVEGVLQAKFCNWKVHWLASLPRWGHRLYLTIRWALNSALLLCGLVVWAQWLCSTVSWAPPLLRATVQTTWLCGARSCAQHLGRATG